MRILNNLSVSGDITGVSFNEITGLSNQPGTEGGVATAGSSTLVSRADHVHPAASGAATSSFTRISESVTAMAGNKIIADSVSGSFNIYLPQGVEGNTIEVWDYYGTWGVNSVNLIPFGTEKIDAIAEPLELNMSNIRLALVYTNFNRGWQIDIGGNEKYTNVDVTLDGGNAYSNQYASVDGGGA